MITLLIDGEHLLWRNYYTHSTLKTSSGEPSGAFYGFLRSLVKLKTLNPSRVYVAWGDKRANLLRRSYFSSYKSTRKSHPDLQSQQQDLQEFLSSLRIPQFMVEGYEADDVIALLARKFSSDQQKVLILTGDKDLCQLISQNIGVLRPRKSELQVVNLSNFSQVFDLPSPQHLVTYLALLGDSSDGIPGVPGIGEVYARRIAKKFNSYRLLSKLLTSNLPELPNKIVKILFSNLHILERNLALIDLVNSPLSLSDPSLLVSFNKNNLCPLPVEELLKKYEIRSINVNQIPHPQVSPPSPVQGCYKCPDLVRNRAHIVNSKFVQPVDILFVAEAPGATEDIEGLEPLTGKAGKLLNQCLQEAGVSRDSVSLANIVRCHPPKNRDPKVEEAQACLSYLLKEISYYRPKLIIPLGNVALYYLTDGNYEGIRKHKGKLIKYKGMTLFPTYHPSYFLHGNIKESEVLVRHLKNAKKLLAGEELKSEEVDYKVIETIEELEEYLEKMKTSPTITFDYETSALFPTEGVPLCLSLSAKPKEARVFPFYRQFLKPIWSEEQLQRIKQLLREFFDNYPHIAKIAHNAEFEYRWSLEHGIAKNITNLQDTLLMHYVIDENSGHKLKDLAVRFLDIDRYEEEVNKLKRRSVHKNLPIDLGDVSFAYIPDEVLWKYAAEDADVTHRLYYIFLEEIKKQGLLDFTFKYLHPLIKFFARMKIRGIKVDTEYLDRIIKIYEDRIREELQQLRSLPEVKKAKQLVDQRALQKEERRLRERYKQLKRKQLSEDQYVALHIKKVYEKLKAAPFNFNSPTQLPILLFDVLKLKKYTTDKGNPSMDKEILAIYASQGVSFIRLLLDYRTNSKFLSTFLQGIKNKLINGRIHPDFLLYGTVTGRLSSRDPNMQNIPKKSNPTKAKEVRKIFVADPDYVLLDADYKQAEFRIWANYANDPQMLQDLDDPSFDIHSKIASEAFNVPIDQVDKDLHRTPAKSVVFGKMYGRGDASVAKQLGITIEQAHRISRVLFDRYPKAEQWLRDQIAKAHREKIVTNLFGRIRHLEGIIDSSNKYTRAEGERYAVNSPIQSGASDLNSLAARLCQRKFAVQRVRAFVLALIHDAIIFQVHKKDLLIAVNIIKTVMRKPTELVKVRLDVDINVGFNLGEMLPLEEFLEAHKEFSVL